MVSMLYCQFSRQFRVIIIWNSYIFQQTITWFHLQ